jgi:hypothetical protein
MILLPLILAIAMQAGPSSPVQVISREMMSQVDDTKQAVARTAPEFAALWRQHAGATPAPAVDFATRTVVAVFLGSRPTAGFTVEIIRTKPAGGKLIVQWQERRPGRDEVAAQILTSPAVIASIPKFAGEITFEKVEK